MICSEYSSKSFSTMVTTINRDPFVPNGASTESMNDGGEQEIIEEAIDSQTQCNNDNNNNKLVKVTASTALQSRSSNNNNNNNSQRSNKSNGIKTQVLEMKTFTTSDKVSFL